MMTLTPPHRAAEALPSPAEESSDEAETIRAAIGGDARAFERVVQAHHRRVFNFLRQMVRHQEDAEDLTQQTFIKAFQNLHRFDCARPIIHWLLTIARHNALNHFRSARKWEFVPVELASAEPSPARCAEDQDQADNLWARARRVLSSREFEALWLRCAEDLSVEETARIMGLTQIHLKVIVHRARQRLLKGENRQ
jgi:RNA polymerase sigma-70 factor (ECF subfamily)